jgi:hypothetical protein
VAPQDVQATSPRLGKRKQAGFAFGIAPFALTAAISVASAAPPDQATLAERQQQPLPSIPSCSILARAFTEARLTKKMGSPRNTKLCRVSLLCRATAVMDSRAWHFAGEFPSVRKARRSAIIRFTRNAMK